MMSPRVPHSLARRLSSLETHLKLLREALARLGREPDLYKLLAAELRVLICDFKNNRPLLLDLMDEFNVGYTIGPDPTLPFPIPLVDEQEPEPPVGFEEWPPERMWEYHRSRGRSFPLREYVRRALAVFILGRSYSYENLVRMLAEQSGLAHEDQTLDRNILEMETLNIGGYTSHTAPLRGLAQHALAAGAAVVGKAAAQGYSPHYLTVTDGKAVYP